MQASRKSEKWVFFIYFQFREIRLLFSAGGQMKRAMNTIWFSLWTPIFSPVISGFSKSAAIRFPKLKSTNSWPCPRSPPCPSFLHTPTRRSISIISSCPHWPCRATPLSAFFPKTHPQPDHSGDDMNYKSQMAHGILACFSFPRASYLIQCEVLNQSKKDTQLHTADTACASEFACDSLFSAAPNTLLRFVIRTPVFLSFGGCSVEPPPCWGLSLNLTSRTHSLWYDLLLHSPVKPFILFSVQCCCYRTPFPLYRSFCSLSPSSGWRLHTRLSFLSGTMFLALLLVPDVWVLKWRDTERNESEFYFLDSRAVFILFRVNTFRFEPRWSFQPTWKS